MFCKNCNKEFSESDGKCPFCGSEVADEKSISEEIINGIKNRSKHLNCNPENL